MHHHQTLNKGVAMTEESISCVDTSGDPGSEAASQTEQPSASAKGATMDIARAGGQAPDFQAMAYQDGGFKQVKLSDYAGKWTVICFYPGDFTFV
jgi:hypothetical protein